MSRAANCYDNVRRKCFWATLKIELIDRRIFAKCAKAKNVLFSCIEVSYKRHRIPGTITLGFESPVDFENNLSLQLGKNKYSVWSSQPGQNQGEHRTQVLMVDMPEPTLAHLPLLPHPIVAVHAKQQHSCLP